MSLTTFFGAATVGITFDKGVVITSDKRANWGYTVISKTATKILPITENIILGSAGVSGDFQALSSYLIAETELFKYENRRPITVKATAQLLSNILFSRRYIPFLTQTLIGGYDEDGPHLYSLDLAGSLIEEKYAAVGSATSLVLGVLEANYHKDITQDEAMKLGIKTVRAATRRDALSGEGIDQIAISPKGLVKASAAEQ